jgi:hypothetical protein
MTKKDQPQARRTAADIRAAHRGHSAASTSRKTAAGFIRLSLWVPGSQVARFKSLAAEACASNVTKDTASEICRQCSDRVDPAMRGKPPSARDLSRLHRDKRAADTRQLPLDLGDA